MPEKAPFAPNPVAERPPAAPKKRRAPVSKRETIQARSRRAAAVAAHLAEGYAAAQCPLVHQNTFELLVAVILSAQCTDAAVNKATPALFARYPTPATLAVASTEEIEALIRTLGLFRAKARSLKRCAQQLLDEFHGEVPSSMEDLTRLAGVGRKTANVIRGHAFDLPGIAVDTHCKRLSRRLGFTRQQDPVKIEHDLSRLLAPEQWTNFSHRLILHGRAVCHARKPNCAQCALRELCPSRDQDAGKALKSA